MTNKKRSRTTSLEWFAHLRNSWAKPKPLFNQEIKPNEQTIDHFHTQWWWTANIADPLVTRLRFQSPQSSQLGHSSPHNSYFLSGIHGYRGSLSTAESLHIFSQHPKISLASYFESSKITIKIIQFWLVKLDLYYVLQHIIDRASAHWGK